ncbi:MAG: archease [Thermoprotei archaeon]|nr:MAG: archease [Thermoprotei archaeon]
MEKKYVFLPHTADAYFAAYGKTLEEAFENAALAMYEVMTDTSKVARDVEIHVEVKGFDEHSLLYNWLEELLFYTDSEQLVFSEFHVENIEKKDRDYVLKAVAKGEKFDPSKHESRNQVKAVTYSLMEINKKDSFYEVKVVLDL